MARLFFPFEVIVKPPRNIASQRAIPEKRGSGVRVPGKFGGFAISSFEFGFHLVNPGGMAP
jgi:hypothetical protein